jgi:CheY-like chemotaxis protein
MAGNSEPWSTYDSPNESGGRVLLLLATRDLQSAEQLTANSGFSAEEMARELHRLTERGFIVAGSAEAGVAVYRLNPKGVRTESPPPQQRILVVDDADALRRLMRIVLEDEGYTIIAVAIQADAVSLLKEVAFDLVITDSFETRPGEALLGAAETLTAAGATPVALFTGHRVELEPAHAAGFADLITKPFDIEVLARQVRTLLKATT